MAEGVEQSSAAVSKDAEGHVQESSMETPAAASTAHDAQEEDEEGDEGEEEGEDQQPTEAGAGADVEGGVTGAPKRRKKKPKKKKKKAVDGGEEVEEIQRDSSSGGASQKTLPAHDINALLQQLAMSSQGQQPDKKEGKAPEDYKFWNTQPVPKFQAPNLLQSTTGANGESLPEGAILPDKVCRASVKPEPEKLVDGFEWCLLDLNDAGELQELYELLYNHYVEDTDGSFRFNYSPSFLAWALKPPGWKKEWHVGVRTKTATSATSEPDGGESKDGDESSSSKKGKLVAFIAGIPVQLRVRASTLAASEINFLAIHRKLRNKRLAPVLIKEVTRRCYQHGVYQALYTAGTLLPTPITTCRYFHRSLDWPHLYKTGFSHLPKNSSEMRQKLKYKLEPQTKTPGLRRMEKRDVGPVRDLLTRYVERFHLRQEFSEEEVEHWLCSQASEGVVWSYVVEGEGGKVTDLFSYYLLESTVLRGSRNETIRAAYLYYYATDAAFTSTSSPSTPPPTLQPRLQSLIHDALILAAQANFHVFNALTLLDNPLFLTEQKFEPGDGKLHFYLFNWRTALVPGGVDELMRVDKGRMGGVGVVML